MVIHLLSQLCFSPGFCTVIAVVSYLQYMFPVVIFIVLGAWTKIMIERYFVVLAYDMLVFLVSKPVWGMYSILQTPRYFGTHLLNNLLGMINNRTYGLFSSERQPVGFLHLPSFLLSFLLPQAEYHIA